MKLCWSVLLSLVFVGLAAAGPHALQGQFSRFMGGELTLSQVQYSNTQCEARAHTLLIHLGGKSYEYKYRLCTNRITQKKCLDSTQSLPVPCPKFDYLTDCIKFKWYVGRPTLAVFEICDDWGVPCQREISGLGRTNLKGDCNYRGGIHWVTLCEEKDGTSDCTETAIMTSNEADNSESDEDCFCVKPKNGEETCKGNCRTTK